jgi:hypothetical protein
VLNPATRAAIVLATMVAAVCGCVVPSAAQALPEMPPSFLDGRLTFGGSVSATVAPSDPGFFNYSDYDHSLVRMFQVDLVGTFAGNEHIAVVGAVRTQNADTISASELYVRARPWKGRVIEVLAGRIPPTFGGFTRRVYTADNPLISQPLANQYLTSLRADALPATADELVRMRGRGWLSSFSVGDPYPDHGVTLVSASRYDTGLQAHASTERWDAAVAITTGTLSQPLVTDNNGSRQFAARGAVHPVPALIVGASFARGGFVSDSAARAAGAEGTSFSQQAWGLDGEYAVGHLVVRGELIRSAWELPIVSQPALRSPVSSTGLSTEIRYKGGPGWYGAARYDRLWFSAVAGGSTVEWDAPVTRVEAGGGYMLQRNLVAKLAYQYNWRDGGRVHNLGLIMAQLLYWL